MDRARNSRLLCHVVNRKGVTQHRVPYAIHNLKWDHELISISDQWLIGSFENQPSRFHFEALITPMHCAAQHLEETDWQQVALFYERLQERYPCPIYQLNHSVAIARDSRADRTLRQTEQVRDGGELKDCYLLHCTIG